MHRWSIIDRWCTGLGSVRRDAGVSEGNATVAIVADCDDEASWVAYRDNPDHQRMIAERIRPHLLARTAVQHVT